MISRPRHGTHRTVTLAASVLLAGAVTAPVAQAAPAPTQAPGVGGQPRHCTLDLGTDAEHCYATFTEAVDHASKGRIDDAPASARTATGDSGFRTEVERLADEDGARADGVIQGTFFDDPGFGGDSLTISGEGLCEKDGWVDYQHDLEDGWKNRISSVQPWGNCWIWLYPEPGLGGDRDGPFKENTGDIGDFMNDRTQSIGFS
ncbi:hypothetical protein DTL70_05415 [Streptomyces diacarni]|uniref:Uncharacterized protein n=1 Tax=Streptomyces diacarni TaxID=2800381 RepID=A0A367FB08_9ACTN|nr:hypothetical protein [Streptomyces diacarni]RCG27129.1 hypothetical protein DTL70_05415 [Streptomyces diacarni]